MRFLKIFKREKSGKQSGSGNAQTVRTVSGGGFSAVKPKVKLASILAAFACCITALILGITGLAGAGGSQVADASMTGASDIVLNDGDKSSFGTVYKNNLTALYRRLGGTGITTYAQLKSYVNTKTKTLCGTSYNCIDSLDIRLKNNIQGIWAPGSSTVKGGNVRVKLGGYWWLVAMVSKIDRTADGTHPNNGELVMTLVLYDSSSALKFGAFTSGGGTKTNYPRGLYASSYIRSYLTGSKYATSATVCSSTYSGTSEWQTFTNTYSSYLVQPKYINYQAYESSNTAINWAHTAPNEAYYSAYSPKAGGCKFYMGGDHSKSYGGDWKNDYIWLPSASELGGYNASYNGLWYTDENFRKCTNDSWTRSNRCCENAGSNIYMKAEGKLANGRGIGNESTYVRPAIHVNLKALDSRNSGVNTSSVARPVWNYSTGTTNNGIYYANAKTAYMSYTGATQRAILKAPNQNTSVAGFGDIGVGSTSPYYVSASQVPYATTSYYASDDSESYNSKYLYRLETLNKGDYYCPDGTYWNTFYIKMYRAVLSLTFNATTFTYDGNPKAPSITGVSGRSSSASKVNNTVGSSYLPSTSDFSIYYTGTTATGSSYSSSTKPTAVGNYKMRVTLNERDNSYNSQSTGWGYRYRQNFTFFDAYSDPDQYQYYGTTNYWTKEYDFVINYGNITSYSISALSGTYNGKAQSLITTHTATTQTSQTWSYSTTSSTSGFSSTIPTRTNAGSQTVWVKVTAPYYNDLVVSRTASISKKSIASGVTWSAWGTYTYSGSAQTPKPTVTHVGSNSVSSSSTSDFSYTYKNNTNAGTATVTITALSGSTNFTGSVSRNFTINKANVTPHTWYSSQGTGVTRVDDTHVTATYSGLQTYAETQSGSARNDTKVNWSFSSTELTWLSSRNDRINFTNAGSYTITQTLKDSSNYRWSDYASNSSAYRYLYINVSKKNISSGVTWQSIGPYVFNSSDIKPTPLITAIGSTSVTTATSYFNYSYSNNYDVGTATVTVTARSDCKNYTGTANRTFAITQQIIDAVHWLDEQDEGITKSGTQLTATYKNGMYYFRAFEPKECPSPDYPGSIEDSGWSGDTLERWFKIQNAGTYTFTWDLDEAGNQKWSNGSTSSIVLKVVINKAYITPSAFTTNTYTGSSNPMRLASYRTSTPVADLPELNDILYVRLYENKSVNDGTTYSSETAPTKAGTYNVYPGVKSAYANNFSTGGVWTYTINRAVATVTWTQYYLKYTGAERYPTFAVSAPSSVAESARPTVNDFTFTGTGIEAGNYTRTAKLNQPFACNFQLAGSSCTAISNSDFANTYCTRTFTIGDITFKLPYWLDMENFTVSDDKLTVTTVYNNTSQEFKAFEGYGGPSPDFDFEVDGYNYDSDNNLRTIKLTNAGTYKFVYALVDPENMEWEDGSTANVTLTIVIEKAKVTGMSGDARGTLIYNGKQQGPKVVSVSFETEIVNAPTAEEFIATAYSGRNGTSYSSTALPINAGDYQVKWTIGEEFKANYTTKDHGDSGYWFRDFTIEKRDLSNSEVEWSTLSTYVYDGSEKKPTPIVMKIGENSVISSSALFNYTYTDNTNAGTAKVTVTAPDDAVNYKGSYEAEFTINKAVVTGVTWNKLVFTYNGEEQCPALSGLTTQTTVLDSAKPLSIFEVTGGQVNAGTYTVTATLKPEHAVNFTTSATDTEATTYEKIYDIEKAYLVLTFGDKQFTYNGLAQRPDFTLETNSGLDIKSEMAVDVLSRGDSYLINGLAVDAGSYTVHVSMTGEIGKNYVKHLNGVAVDDGNWTADFEIEVCKLKIEWTGTEFEYNGAKQGTAINNFAGTPEHGADPFDGLMVTYYNEDKALTGTPVHAGEYSVKVSIANRNYALVDDSNQEIAYATKNFVIKSVSFAGKGGELNWNGLEGAIFNGLAQNPTLDGEYSGLFTADGGRKLVLDLTYAQVGDEGVTGEFVVQKLIYAGTYKVRVTESFGDYLFDDVQFEIAKRKVTVIWKGDSLSRKDGDTFVWMYDGKKHAPSYSVEFEGGADIYRDGKKITDLEITYGSLTNAGADTLSAQLVNNGYNSNFEITSDSITQKIEVERFNVSAVEWYENGSNVPLTEQELAGLHYVTNKVYGEDGPKLVAKGITAFRTDGGVITCRIPLKVSYPTYDEGYWEASETPYKAVATFNTADNASCEFTESVLKDDGGERRVFITFRVAASRADLEKLTITWVIDSDGEEIDINDVGAFDIDVGYGWKDGEFVFLYNGKAQYPKPKAIGEYNNRVEVAIGESGKQTDVGTGYTVHVIPSSGYEIANGASECRYSIIPRELMVYWEGENTYVFGDNPVEHLTASVDEELSFGWLVDGDDLIVSLDSLNAGNRIATAKVYTDGKINDNYILNNNTKEVEITRKPISAKQIDWSKTLANGASEAVDGSGEKYYVFPNDGKAHVPVAELKVTVGGEEKTLKLTVMGVQSKTGSYIAYAILDESDAYNSNFILVVNESASELKETVASQKFEIVKVSIETIIWKATEDGESADKIEYVYDGNAHMPYAIGITPDGVEIALSVWGAQINAGEYVAEVVDDYDYAEGAHKSATFSVLPKKVTVEWQGHNADGEIHFTYDGTEKRPQVNVGGGLTQKDYYVTGYTNAGSHIAEIVFTNKNYTYDATENENANVCGFVIDKREITVSWTGVGNYTPSGAQSGVMYWRYNGTQRGPVASGSFGSIRFGEDTENRIIVSGRETDAGSYVATATLDYSVAANANFKLVNASKQYVITPYEIRVIWTGNEHADGAFEWEYDGLSHNPAAKYKLWNSGEDEWVYPDKIHGVAANVGEYIASIDLPENCVFEKIGGKSCGEQSFSITKLKVTKINWFASADADAQNITDLKDFTFLYNGLSQLPVARVEGTGAELAVTGARINAGTGYIATAALKDAGNYELGAGVNSTYTFGISPVKVMIHWTDTSDKGAFVWSYTGKLICPTAEFTDVDGNKVAITVTGGKISVGTYTAKAHDTFLNYDFSTEEGNLVSHTFGIEALSLGDDFEWIANGGAFTPATDGGNDTYTFGYDGNVHQPVARCTVDGRQIRFAYTIISGGRYVDAIVNAGEYTLKVQSSDGNYTVPNDTVKVVITPKQVSAVWGATQLEYNGSVQTPTAYYVDVHGQCVALAVISDTPIATGKATATADFAETDNKFGNYVLVADPKEFEIKSKTMGSFKWDWTTGKFVTVPAGSSDTAAADCLNFENVALIPSKQTLIAEDRKQA